MKVLFCVPYSLTRSLGGPKSYIEIAEVLEAHGCECTVVGMEEVAPEMGDYDGIEERMACYRNQLQKYVAEHAQDYDVIEYEHKVLPVSRSSLPQDTLMVARTSLLTHHGVDASPSLWSSAFRMGINAGRDLLLGPTGPKVEVDDYVSVAKKYAGTALSYFKEKKRMRKVLARANRTLRNADLIFVNNRHSRERIIKEGMDGRKVRVIHLGMTEHRRRALAPRQDELPEGPPVIAFVGLFQMRKGSADIPRIARSVIDEHPSATFRLLGTRSLFQTKEEVLAHFHPSIRDQIEVCPRFDPSELPDLLEGAHLGIFPSYYEGFGHGVLEMMAAGLPVVAYDAPGPPEMVPDENVVPRGDWQMMSDRVLGLLDNSDQLSACRMMTKIGKSVV